MARIEAEATTNKRQSALQQEVEQLRQQERIAQFRARDLVKTKIEAEQLVEQMKGEAESVRVKAEIAVQSAMKEAEAVRIRSDADLYSKQREAEGIVALRQAEAEGIRHLVSSARDVDRLTRYLAIREGVLERLAEHQSTAMKGLQPKIHVWNTGAGNGDQAVSRTIKDVVQAGMPLFNIINEQTGYDFLKGFGKPDQAK